MNKYLPNKQLRQRERNSIVRTLRNLRANTDFAIRSVQNDCEVPDKFVVATLQEDVQDAFTYAIEVFYAIEQRECKG